MKTHDAVEGLAAFVAKSAPRNGTSLNGEGLNAAYASSACEALFDDLSFAAARRPGRQAEGPDARSSATCRFMCRARSFTPPAVLPSGIFGGGDQLEVIHGDAYYQSYICRIPRSTIELGVSGRLDFVDGMLFPSICDVIRNLSGMWKIMFPNVSSAISTCRRIIEDEIGGSFYISELAELRERSRASLRGKPISDDELRASIGVYNENRRAGPRALRAAGTLALAGTGPEAYLVLRAGLVLPVEEHSQMIRDYLAAATKEAAAAA